MNTKSDTPRLHPFLCACAVSLWLGMAIIAGPALALDTTTSTYGGVNVFRFTLYGFTGVDAPVWTSTRILDSVTYGGQIGVEAGDGAVNMGLRYGFQLGSHSARHGVFATFRYEF